MPAQPALHPSADQLSAFALGKLDDQAEVAIHQHLEACEPCRRIASNAPGDSFVDKVRSARGKVSVTAPTPPPAANLATQAPAASPLSAPDIPNLPPELASHPKFHILRELGRGGMGVVYQAEHRLMKRPVAIKVLNPRLLDNPMSLARFHQESEAAAQLSHPNIVAAHDAEQAGNLHLLVMEFIEGQSLAQVLQRKGPLPIIPACKFAWQVARGLQHAHEKQMVHRDIKPQNLMLTPQGVIKILDFGLARLAQRPSQEGLTRESVTMGTPEYIAPEQANDARQADIRSDIYSLGCTLYCLLCGHPPFPGETPIQTILGHLEKQAPPLHELRAEVPPALSAVVERMLAKKPEDRYQTPGEVMAALAPFCKPGGQAPVPSGKGKALSRPARPRRRRLLALLAVVAVLGMGSWLLAAFVLRVNTPQGLIVLEVDQPGAEVSVDGQRLKLQVPGDNQPIEIRTAPGRRKLWISKEGFVAVTRDIELTLGKAEPIRIRLEPQARADARPVEPPESAPAGDNFVALFNDTDFTGWFVVNSDTIDWQNEGGVITGTNRSSHVGTGGRIMSQAEFANFHLRLEVLAGQRGGSHIRFRAPRPPVTGQRDGYMVPFPDSAASTDDGWGIGSLHIDVFQRPSERLLASDPPDLGIRAHDWYRLEIIAEPERIRILVNGKTTVDYKGKDPNMTTGCIVFNCPAGARTVFRKVQIKELQAPTQTENTEPDGSPLYVFKDHRARVQRVLFSPDGTRLLSGSNGNHIAGNVKQSGPDNSVRVFSLESGQQVRNFNFTAPRVFGVQDLCVSPDGKSVAACTSWDWPHPWMCPWTYVWDISTSERTHFFQRGEQAFQGAVTFADNGSMLRVATGRKQIISWTLANDIQGEPVDLSRDSYPLAFAASGKWLLGGDNQGTVWVWDVKDGQKVTSLSGHVKAPRAAAVSPDEKRLLSAAEDYSVRLWDMATGKELFNVKGLDAMVRAVAFCPDGDRFVTGGDDGIVRLWKGSTGKELARFPGHTERVNSVAVSPDGKLMASASNDTTIRVWRLPAP